MKVLTIGWSIVFSIMGLINIYIFNSYLEIPFKEFRNTKLSIYIIIHILLSILSIYYFYLFFSAKTDRKYNKILSKVAGFQIVLTSYAAFFYLMYDLVYITRNIFNYPDAFRELGIRIFFEGFIVFGLSSIIALTALYNGSKIKLKTYRVNMDKKSSGLSKLNIVFLSDGHINSSLTSENIDSIIERVNGLKPDIVLLGGDFFDEGTSRNDKLISSSKLAKLSTSYGTYAVEGNHEYKSGNGNIDEEMDYFIKEGIKVLRDQVYNTGDFYIIGRKDQEHEKTLGELVGEAEKDLPIILLNHKSSFKETLEEPRIELQLSGHTHNGQYIPLEGLNLVSGRFRKEHIYGHKLRGNLNLIVSSGIGNWGIPVRLGSRREIVKIEVTFN